MFPVSLKKYNIIFVILVVPLRNTSLSKRNLFEKKGTNKKKKQKKKKQKKKKRNNINQ